VLAGAAGSYSGTAAPVIFRISTNSQAFVKGAYRISENTSGPAFG
jgi:hypothetical protein